MGKRPTLALIAWLALMSLLGGAHAADGRVSSVEPTSTGQGETVLLTIKGEALPQGTLVIEFFPQQIALLDILAASPTEIQALVKVSHTAPPGQYNIMVYNQRGEEAFGESLLTVGASVITPVFKNFDPKAIADASSGFALLLTGEYITEASISHLSIEWEQAGQKVGSLVSSFSLGGSRAVVCAVEGTPPPGVLRGRIFLDGVPIYLVEVTVEGASALIVGHAPSQLSAASNLLKLKLLGSGLTAAAVRGLAVQLSSEAVVVKAQQVVLLDSASCEAEFAGPLPAGEYQLEVVSAGSQVYSGVVVLSQTETPEAGQPDNSTTGDSATGPVEPGSEGAGSKVDGNTLPEPPTDDTTAVSQPETPPDGSTSPHANLRVLRVSPEVIDPSVKACRFTLETTGLEDGLLAGLAPSLEIAGETAMLLLSGSSGAEMTCVFSPPADGWQAGAVGELSLWLPDEATAAALVEVKVGEAKADSSGQALLQPDTGESIPPAPVEAWEAVEAVIISGAESDTLQVSLKTTGTSGDFNQLEVSFTLLPDELGYADMFANLTLSGKLEVVAVREGFHATTTGHFVSGSLMITVRQAGGTPQLSMLWLDAPSPGLRVTAPKPSVVSQDVVSGGWKPPTLTWVVDTTPLWTDDPRFFTVVDANGKVAETTTVVEGSLVSISCPVSELAAGGEVSGELECALPVELTGETKLRIAVGSPGAVPGTALDGGQTESPTLDEKGIDFVEPRLHLCPEGLWVLLAAPGSNIGIAEWRDVQVQVSELLLQNNLDKFSPEVQAVASSSAIAHGTFRLLLRRDPGQLSDVAFDLLRSQLMEDGTCSVTLSWLSLGQTITAELEIDERPWGTAGLTQG